MKLGLVFGLVAALLTSQSFAQRGGKSHSFKPTQSPANSGRPAEDTIGKTKADKSVQWEYSVTLKPGASLEEIRRIKKELRKNGASFNWGSADEPVFGIKTWMSEDEIKGISENVASAEGSEPTKKYKITLNQNESFPKLKAKLEELANSKENPRKMQITFRAGDQDKPFYIVVKSNITAVGEIYALIGQYIGGEGTEPGVEEVN
ncbi:MAG: hypothetical protein EBQ92_09260 [Proteobacteria bacterium]|nr:hypothetical protein [Pseudomonadota bacterium]